MDVKLVARNVFGDEKSISPFANGSHEIAMNRRWLYGERGKGLQGRHSTVAEQKSKTDRVQAVAR